MNSSQLWYLNQNLAYYKPVSKHPGWLTAQSTADWDIFWFKTQLNERWREYGFDYEGTPVFLRYRKQDDEITLEAHIPAEAIPENPEPMQGLCSIYLSNSSEQLDQTPFRTVQYPIFTDFDNRISFPWTADDLYIGLHVGVLYTEKGTFSI